MTNNAAERGVRGIAVGRNNWTFAGSDEGGRRAAAIYTLIETAKLNDIDPQAWLADMLARLQDHPAKRIAELLPGIVRIAAEDRFEQARPLVTIASARGLHRMRTAELEVMEKKNPRLGGSILCRGPLLERGNLGGFTCSRRSSVKEAIS